MSRWLGRLALAAALAIVAAPLARPWTIAGHSTTLELVRLEALRAAVAGGDLWPRWLPDLYARHGSPLPIFYAPLAYRLPLLLILVGCRNAAALQIALALSWVSGALGAGWAARRWWGPGAGTTAATLFGLAPYLLLDIYGRAAFAEVAAMALLPWVLGALTLDGARGRAALALGVAALVLTHNVTALVAMPWIALLAAGTPGRERWAKLAALACGIGLAAFFWIPALLLRGAVWAEESLTGGIFDPHRHLQPLALVLPFGAGETIQLGAGHVMPARLGELGWLVLLVAPSLLVRGRDRARLAVLLAAGWGATLMTAQASAPLWDLLPLVRYVQFPFRMLLLASVALALLGGAAAARLGERARTAVIVLLAVAGVAQARPWLDVRYAFLDPRSRQMVVVEPGRAPLAARDPRLSAPDALLDVGYLRRHVLSATSLDDFLPRTVTVKPEAAAPAAVVVQSGPVRVLASEWGYPTVNATLEAAGPGWVALSQFDFPGWRVEVDGAPRATRTEAGRGRILVPVGAGDRELVARFGATPLTRTATALSAVALLSLLFVARWRWPSERPE